MTRRNLPVTGFLRSPCPDCSAEWRDGDLEHEPTCPIGAGIDDVCDQDRQYFADHPGEFTATRGITWAELQTLEHLGTLTPTDRPDHVHIFNAPWGRVRTFCNSADFSGLAIDPDDDEAAS
jgi:hypothetical protein